jgi:hypothetical protein
MITKWKFYAQAISFNGNAIKPMWHEITHEKTQDLIYRHGHRKASPHIRIMMRYHDRLCVGSFLLKMEEMPCQQR